MNTVGIILPMTVGLLLEDALPLYEYQPFAQMGIAAVVLMIWWVERKERRERQDTDDKRYESLLVEFRQALKERIVRCPLAEQAERFERALERVTRATK